MKTIRYLLAIQLLFFSFQGFCQETGVLEGKVIDALTSEALIGTNIQIEGTLTGTTTDLDGMYKLEGLKEGTYKIKVSFIGYQSILKQVSVTTGQTSTQDFQLAPDLLGLDQVVVTGVVNQKSALESSVALTTLKPKAITELGATTTAEVFKSIPGIHSESTGGEGNANISVRGVPISTGGAKFMQLHEDGLPVLQFGDIMFGNADIFLRIDKTISRIEAIRGGSASTFASNSPAGIINFISNTGAVEGGTIGMTMGLDYRDFRTDFNYGAPIGDDLYFDIGGFYRQGEGIRNCGYDGNLGGQLKANVTKRFDNGHVRIYFKHLNDRAISYMPMPILVSETGENPKYESINGVDLKYAALQNSEFFNMPGIDAGGNPRTTNISDGMHPISDAVGTEFSFKFGNDWKIVNRNRFANTKGSFRTLSPTGLIGTADEVAQSILGDQYTPGYTFSYANGVNAGQTLSSQELSSLNGNGLLMQLASFDVDINSFDNFTNDLNVSKKIDMVNLTFGFYKAYQEIATYWNWQGYITDVSEQPKLINLASADSSYYMEGGVTNYGIWGLGREYDMKYNISAPYANVEVTLNDNINIDASMRYDYGVVNGYYLNSKSAKVDVNQDGTISPVESSCNIVDNTNPHAVSYDYDYLSYSIGANLKIHDGMAVYGRYSRGGRANADRLLYTQFITDEGKAVSDLEADMLSQVEVGLKYNSPTVALMVTPYYSNVKEQNADVTENKIYLIKFETYGAEVEASAHFGGFAATAGAIYTNAKIKESLDESTVGNIPRRVPAVMYNVNPSYAIGRAKIGLSLIGTTKVYSQNDNKVVMPAFAYLNVFASFEITKGLSLSTNINNILNTMGYTEMEGDTFTENTTNYMRARPITGRASTLSLTYTF
jgi:outer membrane receptor protein involved in Fe transport